MKKKKTAILLLALSVMTTLLGGCANGDSADVKAADIPADARAASAVKDSSKSETSVKPLAQTFFIFDTVVTIKIYDSRATANNFKELEALMKDIDRKISRTNEDSEIHKVNAQAGIAPVEVSPDTFGLVQLAVDYARKTDGLLDPSIGPLVSLWNIGHEGAHVPPAADIEAARKLTDYRRIELNPEKHEIYLRDKGMQLDLGSYGKGYAADAIYDYLAEQGFSSAIIDLGGNIFAMGSKPGGSTWNIGIQDPSQERGNPIGTVRVEDKTVVTAGIYERFFVEDGKLYQHIIDPRSGYPVDNNISSVTIVTDRSIDADTMDTSLLIMGIEDGLKFAENTPNTEVLFITKDKKLHASPGFKEMLKKTNDSYTFAN